MRLLFLIPLVLAWAFGQTSPVPYAPGTDGPGPTFKNEIVETSLPGRYSDIHKVDFRNLAPMKNGRYREDEQFSHSYGEVNSVYYLNLSSGGQGALVLYSWSGGGGSSSQAGVAQVYRTLNGTLRSTQRISWDPQVQTRQSTGAFDARTKTLVIRSAHYIPGDAHCCVSAVDVVTLRWDGTALVQTNIQTELSDYGKNEGKTLPR